MSGGGRYHVVDATTGEDFGPLKESRPGKSRTSYGQTGQRARAAIADLAVRSATALVVLEWLCRQAGTDGALRVSQGEIARRVGKTRQAVSRALGLLESEGWVASESAAGGKKAYWVDPEYCWRGYPTSAAMSKSGFYEVRKAAGAQGTPAWRGGADPWRLTTTERRTMAVIPDSDRGGTDDADEREVEGYD